MSFYTKLYEDGFLSKYFIDKISTYANPIDLCATAVDKKECCCVCYVKKDVVRINACGHELCSECLLQIYRTNPCCPMCRHSLINDKELNNQYKYTPLDYTVL